MTTTFQVRKAERRRRKLRLSLTSTTGGGKTFTALLLATALVKGTGKRVLLIDTEGGSSEIYADRFDFDVLPLKTFSPLIYVDAIAYAAAEGYGCTILDSLSHAWIGKDGALQQVDEIAARAGQRGSSFNAWGEVTPQHNALIEAVLHCPMHLIATMRQKAEYVVEQKNGKSVPRKVGMAPVQRDGMEYEFDICGDLIPGDGKVPSLVVTKTRMSELSGKTIKEPGEELGTRIRKWLEEGSEAPAPAVPGATATVARAAAADPAPAPPSARAEFWAIVGQWTGMPPGPDRRAACMEVAQRCGMPTIESLPSEKYEQFIAQVKQQLDAGVDWMEYASQKQEPVVGTVADCPNCSTATEKVQHFSGVCPQQEEAPASAPASAPSPAPVDPPSDIQKFAAKFNGRGKLPKPATPATPASRMRHPAAQVDAAHDAEVQRQVAEDNALARQGRW